MGSFRADESLHRPTPPGHISSTQRVGKCGSTVSKVAAHQKENKNTGKKETKET